MMSILRWKSMSLLLLLILTICCHFHQAAPVSTGLLQRAREKRQQQQQQQHQQQQQQTASSLTPAACADPGTPRHGRREGGDDSMSSSFEVGAKVTYTCLQGYRLQGWPELTCNYDPASSTAAWSDAAPQCIGERERIILIDH